VRTVSVCEFCKLDALSSELFEGASLSAKRVWLVCEVPFSLYAREIATSVSRTFPAVLSWSSGLFVCAYPRECRISGRNTPWRTLLYVAFFYCALTFAHLSRCAAAIFRRAAVDRVRLAAALFAFPANTDCGPLPASDHRALWA
jgi:hypothetical protein